MDVTETERELCIELDVPGVAREDLELSVDGDLLTLRGQRRGASHGEGAQPTLHLAERAHGRFERALRLPFAARTEHCQASLRDGVLTIRLAKADAQRKARRIEVQAAQTHAAPEQRTPLEPGQTELLDADPPAGGAAAQAARQARRGSPRAARQQDEPRAR